MRKQFACLLLLALYLGCYKGYLALWDTEKPDPLQIYPCPVTSLPAADQTALEEGVPIRNQLELAQRLEDYLS